MKKIRVITMLRKLCYGLLLFVVLLTSWIAYNSIDEPPRYDQSLLLPEKSIPDEQNGFALLRYLDRDYDKTVLLKNSDFDRLIKVTDDWENWDSRFAQRLLSEHSNVLEQISEVVKRPYFQLNQSDDVYASTPLPGRLLEAARISLLKSRAEMEVGNLDAAINAADTTLKFCEKIRQDSSGNMISYLIGNVCITKVFNLYHITVSHYDLTDSQFRKIEFSMEAVSSYNQDGFENAIRGIYTSTSRMVYSQKQGSLIYRWSRYTEYWKGMQKEKASPEFSPQPLDKAYTYLALLFPDYYIHTNAIMNAYSPVILDTAARQAQSCSNMPVAEEKEKNESSLFSGRVWIDFITPDSVGKIWRSWYTANKLDGYISRRCQTYNYFSAIKTVVAIKHFEAIHGEKPTTLKELAPEYLAKMPFDYFSSDPLQYSPDTGWLYSEGLHHDNKQGSANGFYKGRCRPKSDAPKNECDLKPTFPVDWNEYKYYSALHGAEAGNTDDQRKLGWMYHFGHYTKSDPEKAIYWYTKAAEKHDAHAENLLGLLYEEKPIGCSNPGQTAIFENNNKSLEWYRKSYEDGSLYGGNGYAQHLMSGKGGEQDLQKAARILIKQAALKNVEYDGSLLYTLRNNQLLSGANSDVLVAAWADYYLKHTDLLSGFASDSETGEEHMHNLLAYYYRRQIAYHTHNPDLDWEKFHSSWDQKAYEHYQKANNKEKKEEIDKERMKPTESSIKPTGNYDSTPHVMEYSCKMFNRKNIDYANFESVQQQIFQHPKQAKNLIKSFEYSIKKLYANDAIKNSGKMEPRVLNFHAIPASELIQIMFYAMDTDSSGPELVFDKEIKELPIMVNTRQKHPLIETNLLLAAFGIGTECQDNRIRFYIENPEKAKPRFFTTLFINHWDKSLLIDNQLNGNGKITFENNLSYTGDIKDSHPNGKGAYMSNQDELFSGDHFVDGMLYGEGESRLNNGTIEKGHYQINRLNGYGSKGLGYFGSTGSCFVQEGNFKDGVMEQQGKITYFDCGDIRNYYLPLDHNYPPTWSFTGTFSNGQKTIGTCSVYKDRKIADTFSCEFYEDTLVKIGDVSLLPPDMATPEGLQAYLN